MSGEDFNIVRAGQALCGYGDMMGDFNATGQTPRWWLSVDSLKEMGLIVDGKFISPTEAIETLKKQGRLDEIHCMAIHHDFIHFVRFYESIKNN